MHHTCDRTYIKQSGVIGSSFVLFSEKKYFFVGYIETVKLNVKFQIKCPIFNNRIVQTQHLDRVTLYDAF